MAPTKDRVITNYTNLFAVEFELFFLLPKKLKQVDAEADAINVAIARYRVSNEYIRVRNFHRRRGRVEQKRGLDRFGTTDFEFRRAK